MNKLNRNELARLSGLLYLALIIFGVFSLMYVPSEIMNWESSSKTLAQLKNKELLFKLGIVSGLLMALSFLLLAFTLFKLFEEVDKSQGILLLVFVAISVALSFANMVHKLDVLTLLNQPVYFDSLDLETQIMQHFESYNNGIKVNGIFWGLWLLPFGYLVYSSGFLPKLLGVFLVLGGVGYLLEFAVPLFTEAYANSLLATIIGIPSMIGEFGICLWLLIMGAKTFSFSNFKKRVS